MHCLLSGSTGFAGRGNCLSIIDMAPKPAQDNTSDRLPYVRNQDGEAHLIPHCGMRTAYS